MTRGSDPDGRKEPCQQRGTISGVFRTLDTDFGAEVLLRCASEACGVTEGFDSEGVPGSPRTHLDAPPLGGPDHGGAGIVVLGADIGPPLLHKPPAHRQMALPGREMQRSAAVFGPGVRGQALLNQPLADRQMAIPVAGART